MLDPEYIRQNVDLVRQVVANRKTKVSLESFLEADANWRSSLTELNNLRAEQNKLSSQIPTAAPAEKQQLLAQASEIKDAQKKLEEVVNALEKETIEALQAIPNLYSADTPIGADDTENIVLRKFGEPATFSFTPKDHVDIGTSLGLIELEKASQISGARFYYTMGDAVRLHFALIQLAFDTLSDSELMQKLGSAVGHPNPGVFKMVLPPMLMRSEVMKQMDRLDPVDERYQTTLDGLMLVGSAEHTLGPLHMHEIIPEKDLPIRYVGYSSAFRRESGSYGKDTRGILRVHQFEKIEMETFVTADMGAVEQKFMVAIQEYLMQQLQIPYQVVQVCSGDMGKPDYNQIDIECWVPSQNKYRETHSSDYVTDYQSRRLGTKSLRLNGEKEFVHMNDATVFAIGRTLIAILENYQQADGSVLVPKVLQKFVGKEVIK